MATDLVAGWYPDPDARTALRWWDGQAWTETRQSTVTVACGRCGAGHRVPTDYPGYQCTACGATRHCYKCPDANCTTVSDLDGMAPINTSIPCRACGRVSWIGDWRSQPSTVGAALGTTRVSDDEELSDPRRRLVAGLVTAASMIPSVLPNSLCILRFVSSHVGVMAVGHSGFAEVCQIDYSKVDMLEVTGTGTRTHMTGPRFFGGGFGVEGALEGMAVAAILNYFMQTSTVVHDTVVNFKAGERQVLMNNFAFDPAFLRVLLAPVYERIKKVRGSTSLTPAGWYLDPTQPGGQRYWDGTKWTEHTAP